MATLLVKPIDSQRQSTLLSQLEKHLEKGDLTAAAQDLEKGARWGVDVLANHRPTGELVWKNAPTAWKRVIQSASDPLAVWAWMLDQGAPLPPATASFLMGAAVGADRYDLLPWLVEHGATVRVPAWKDQQHYRPFIAEALEIPLRPNSSIQLPIPRARFDWIFEHGVPLTDTKPQHTPLRQLIRYAVPDATWVWAIKQFLQRTPHDAAAIVQPLDLKTKDPHPAWLFAGNALHTLADRATSILPCPFLGKEGLFCDVWESLVAAGANPLALDSSRRTPTSIVAASPMFHALEARKTALSIQVQGQTLSAIRRPGPRRG
jgi:hypothetical protein